MEKAITTALLVIASVVAALALINVVLPAMGRSSGALVTANTAATNRVNTDIDIIHATGVTTTNVITVWVKNIGTQVVRPVESSDVILTTPTGAKRLPYVSGCSVECWDYVLEGGSANWSQSVTAKFTLRLTSVATGVYSVKISAFNSVSSTKDFSV